MPELMLPGNAPMGIDPNMEDPAHNVEGIYSEDLDFLGLPPEKAQELMDLIQAFLQMSMQEEGGQMPPMDPMMAVPQGPMPQGPMPQGMPPMPQGAPQIPPGGLQLPPAPMGMQEGGMVPDDTMEDLHHQIAETKAKLKEREKEVRDSYQPQKQQQQQQQMGFQQGGQVPLAQQQTGVDLRPFVQQAMNSRMKRRQAIDASMSRGQQPARGYQEGGRVDPDYQYPPGKAPSAVQEWRDMGGRGLINMGELAGRSRTSTSAPSLDLLTPLLDYSAQRERWDLYPSDPTLEPEARQLPPGFGGLSLEEVITLARQDAATGYKD